MCEGVLRIHALVRRVWCRPMQRVRARLRVANVLNRLTEGASGEARGTMPDMGTLSTTSSFDNTGSANSQKADGQGEGDQNDKVSGAQPCGEKTPPERRRPGVRGRS